MEHTRKDCFVERILLLIYAIFGLKDDEVE
jgi:hypothetical protein